MTQPSREELPKLPDDDSDFTPDLARKIIAKYQELLRSSAQEPPTSLKPDLLVAALYRDLRISSNVAYRPWFEIMAALKRDAVSTEKISIA